MRAVAVAAVLALALALAVTSAWGATWTVNPGESIQAAINAASAGDTINVSTGSYDEVLTINKALTLRGAGASSTFLTYTNTSATREQLIMLGATTGSTITGSVTIEGFSLIMGAGISGSTPDIIKLRARSDGGLITIRGNYFNANSVANVDAIVESYGAANFVITNNEFLNAKYAVYLNNAYDGQITHNTLTGARIGMGGNDAEGNGPRDLVVSYNTIDGATYGMVLANNIERIDFSYNNICNSTSAAVLYWEYGTWLEWDGVTFHYNNFDDNADGFKGFNNPGASFPVLVDARYNWWGDASGPSGGLADPVTGTLANGTGDSILTGNLRWDEYLTEPIPEPATLALLGAGLAVLASRRRKVR